MSLSPGPQPSRPRTARLSSAWISPFVIGPTLKARHTLTSAPSKVPPPSLHPTGSLSAAPPQNICGMENGGSVTGAHVLVANLVAQVPGWLLAAVCCHPHLPPPPPLLLAPLLPPPPLAPRHAAAAAQSPPPAAPTPRHQHKGGHSPHVSAHPMSFLALYAVSCTPLLWAGRAAGVHAAGRQDR